MFCLSLSGLFGSGGNSRTNLQLLTKNIPFPFPADYNNTEQQLNSNISSFSSHLPIPPHSMWPHTDGWISGHYHRVMSVPCGVIYSTAEDSLCDTAALVKWIICPHLYKYMSCLFPSLPHVYIDIDLIPDQVMKDLETRLSFIHSSGESTVAQNHFVWFGFQKYLYTIWDTGDSREVQRQKKNSDRPDQAV